jgi:hypothetical protein
MPRFAIRFLLIGALTASADENPVTAIDVLLEPDAIMLRHAEANNARFLNVYPEGFPLDKAHRPHITLLQRFVRTADLNHVYAAAEKVLAGANIMGMRLEAFKYYYTPGKDTRVAGIDIRPTPALVTLQEKLVTAVAPFTVATGPIGAFTAAHADAANDELLISYVSTFVPKQTGEGLVHTSAPASPPAITSTKCSLNRSRHSLSRQRVRLSTSLARSERLRRNSRYCP